MHLLDVNVWLALSFERHPHANEPVGIVQQWRAYTQHHSYSHKIWTDAYLATFARAADFELVTFDHDFAPYDGLKCKVLP